MSTVGESLFRGMRETRTQTVTLNNASDYRANGPGLGLEVR